jgi:ribosomal protein L11 methyltransferase
MLELFPEGFAEEPVDGAVELVAFTDESGARRLREAFGEVTTADVAPGWEDAWQRFHIPAIVGSLWIGPPWEQPAAHLTAIVVDPGQAFGTGGHATTRLCLELLQELERGSVLDVGCGSGVLAIAAAKLGFAPVVAVDSDEAAVEASLQNAARNGVDVDIRRADALTDPLPEAELVLANLDLATLATLAPRLTCGVVVTSGYSPRDRLELPGFRQLRRRAKKDWAADLFARE